MPNKSRNSSRNSSRKSTASSQGKPVVRVSEEDYPSIVVASKPLSVKKTTAKTSPPTTPRPEFLEPLSPKPITPPPTPWEHLGMAEPEYMAMMERVKKMYLEMDKKNYQEALLDDLDSPSYWNSRIEQLEKEREYFNKKRGWSAMDIACVDSIDAQIYECEQELERIYAEADRLEVEYD